MMIFFLRQSYTNINTFPFETMNNLRTFMQTEAARLEQSIQDKESQLAGMPEGMLKSYEDSKRHRRYVISFKTMKIAPENDSDDNNEKIVRERRYIKSSESDLAEQLAIKGLIQAELSDERRELNAINRYLKCCSSYDAAQNYINSNNDICALVDKYKAEKFIASTSTVNVWLSQRSGVSAGHEKGLRVKTHAGFNVRSKSERDILHALMDFGIPYKYEEQLITDIGPLFPDFTILNPLNGEEVIWEHNGSMDDPVYATKVFKRTAAYYRAGYHPGKNFILTYEENNEGLDRDWIESIIKHYFTNPYLELTAFNHSK